MIKTDSNANAKGRHARPGFFRLLAVALAGALALVTFAAAAQEPSTDRRNPTPITAASVGGEGDGDAATHYWRFTAGKGEVKLSAHARTKAYSTLVDFELLDESGRSLDKVSVAANEAGRTGTLARNFVRRQPVIVKVFLREDRDIKHVKYELELAGAVEFDGGTPGASTSSAVASGAGATAVGPQTTAASGDRLCLPATGTLVLTTADGQSYEIELSQVTKAVIKN